MDNKKKIRKRKREDLVDLDVNVDPKKSELLQSHIVKEQTQKNGVTLSDLRSMPTSVVQERRLRLKIEISELAERILADPERSIMESKTFLETTTPQVVIHKPRANLLSSLQHFCGDADPVIRQLSVLSCAAVFRDLLPGYSIRVIGESEKNVRLKKEVKKLRDYESRLLLAYQKFLKLLEFLTISGEGSEKHKSKMTDFLSDSDAKVAKGLSQRDYDAAKMSQKRHQEDINLGIVHHDGDSPETLSMLGVCALSAMADLLRAAPHFNFRKNLINFLVPRMNSKDLRLQDAACRGIEGLFSSDHSFEASLEAVQVLARCVEKYITQTENLARIFVNHPARVSPAAIRTLCSLKLTVLERMDSSLINVQKGKKSKKKMDDKATVSDIDAGLKAADAESLKERSRFAKGTLKQVVLIFFRILRSQKHSELLPPVLLGLSKFAHLLDVEIVSNLLTCLKALIRSRMQRAEGSQLDTNTKSNEEDLSAEVVLRCVLTSIRIMSGPALRVLSSDETDLTRSFYSILPQIISEDWSDIEETASSSDRESATPLALLSALCVQGLFLRKRDAVPSEMAAFAKRILSIAVSLPQGECLALVSCFRGILNRYSSTSEILSPLVSRPQVSLWGHAKSQQSTIITSDPTLSMAEGSTASFEGLNHLQMTYSKAWELGGCLLRHFHPSVVSFARSASLLEPLLPSHQPSTVHKAHNGDVTGEFNPPIQVPKRHPLAALVESSLKDEKKSTGKSRLFFLRPTSREKAMFTEEDTTILAESVTDKTFRKIHRAI